jgi:uncharacterized protein (TIGR00251 family)
MAAASGHGGQDSPLTAAEGGVHLALHVTPRSSRNRIEGIAPGADAKPRLRVAVTAPPENGKANEAVFKLLARAWKLRKSDMAVKTGAASRDKLIHIAGDAAALLPALNERIAGTDG